MSEDSALFRALAANFPGVRQVEVRHCHRERGDDDDDDDDDDGGGREDEEDEEDEEAETARVLALDFDALVLFSSYTAALSALGSLLCATFQKVRDDAGGSAGSTGSSSSIGGAVSGSVQSSSSTAAAYLFFDCDWDRSGYFSPAQSRRRARLREEQQQRRAAKQRLREQELAQLRNRCALVKKSALLLARARSAGLVGRRQHDEELGRRAGRQGPSRQTTGFGPESGRRRSRSRR